MCIDGTESQRSEVTESGRVYQHPTVVLVKSRTMSESDSQLKEGTAGNHASAGTELKECVVCGAVGLPERIRNHDCNDFLDHKEVAR